MEPACSESEFLKSVDDHKMEIIKEDGVYRHVRFSRPRTRCMQFDLITWPGYLCYCGDMGEFVFSRAHDMFEFFRNSGHRHADHPALAVNFGYWAEKCLAAAGRGDGVKEYSADKFREVIKDILDDDEDITGDLREAVDDQVLSCADDGPYAAHEAARDFRWNGKEYFTDFWEQSLDVYTHRFVWCCYALAWGILTYDNKKTAV